VTDWPKNAIPLGGDPSAFPPFSKERQDAEIEVLRFALCQLAGALHERGLLDLKHLTERIGNAQWLWEDKPHSFEAAMRLADTLSYMRAKLGEPGRLG